VKDITERLRELRADVAGRLAGVERSAKAHAAIMPRSILTLETLSAIADTYRVVLLEIDARLPEAKP
jgi:hypothetical protein